MALVESKPYGKDVRMFKERCGPRGLQRSAQRLGARTRAIDGPVGNCIARGGLTRDERGASNGRAVLAQHLKSRPAWSQSRRKFVILHAQGPEERIPEGRAAALEIPAVAVDVVLAESPAIKRPLQGPGAGGFVRPIERDQAVAIAGRLGEGENGPAILVQQIDGCWSNCAKLGSSACRHDVQFTLACAPPQVYRLWRGLMQN